MLRPLILRFLLAALLLGVAVIPGSEGWAGMVTEGDRLASEHRLLSAIGLYRQAEAFPGAFPLAQLRMGSDYLRRGQPRDAAGIFRQVESAGAVSREALIGEAEALDRLGDRQGAVATLHRELQLQSGDLQAWNLMVDWAARAGMQPSEIRDLLKGIPLPRGEGALGQRADYLLGAAVMGPGEGDGIGALRQAAAGPDPGIKAMALELLGAGGSGVGAERAMAESSVLLAQRLTGPALARLQGLGSDDASLDAAAWALRAYAEEQLDRNDQADQAARRSLQIEPVNPLANLVLGMLSVARGDYQGAVTRLVQVVDRVPPNPALYVELANALVAGGDYGDAERALNLAIRAAPDDASLRLDVARFYVDRQFRLEEGLTQAQEAVRLDGNSAEAQITLAWAFHLSKRTEEGLKAAQKAMLLDPESALVRYRLGSMYEALGKSEQAREQYRMVEELDGSGDLWRRAKPALDGMH